MFEVGCGKYSCKLLLLWLDLLDQYGIVLSSNLNLQCQTYGIPTILCLANFGWNFSAPGPGIRFVTMARETLACYEELQPAAAA